MDQALAAVRGGDTLVVPSSTGSRVRYPMPMQSAATSPPGGGRLQLGASVHDPAEPMENLFFNILATFAEFEADLIRMNPRGHGGDSRQREAEGKQPKLTDRQQKELGRMHGTGDQSINDLAELFSITRPTACRTLRRQIPDRDGPLIGNDPQLRA